ncbi:amidohydrolase family protein [Williamsia sterculiae]|uniref:Predicted metal-dependent hydrolase, TIM-barrel fold n=1 Tax=Williamsia sterculiae TaxID=1344003 RepID=A0A1N7CMS4_9NOCA|nr:amidohydrolase family protein [Williamsia sterculiae]SIR64747.1 Predicted metal-dependent hydrolase, TIM-barrel fold [Williamsia sterculiae]
MKPISPSSLNRRQLFGATAAAAGAAAVAGTTAGAASAETSLPRGNYRIDLHAHFLPPEYRAALISHGYFTIGGYPTPQWSPESAIDFMDRWGIQAQALSVSDPGVSFLRGREARDMARYCNTYAANLFKRDGRRFGAFAVLPMPDIAASVVEATYALDTLRLDGVILLSAYDGVYLGDPRFEPLMAALNARRAYVFVHPASIPDDVKPNLPLPDFLYEFTFDTTRAATYMMTTGVRNRYPNIRFQLAHAGGTLPFLSKRIGVASETPLGNAAIPKVSLLGARQLISSYYYDTALSASEAAMRSVLAVSDRSHIVFGSDWPFSALTFTGSGDPAPDLSEVFTADQRVEVERTNPLRQLPRLADAVR